MKNILCLLGLLSAVSAVAAMNVITVDSGSRTLTAEDVAAGPIEKAGAGELVISSTISGLADAIQIDAGTVRITGAGTEVVQNAYTGSYKNPYWPWKDGTLIVENGAKLTVGCQLFDQPDSDTNAKYRMIYVQDGATLEFSCSDAYLGSVQNGGSAGNSFAEGKKQAYFYVDASTLVLPSSTFTVGSRVNGGTRYAQLSLVNGSVMTGNKLIVGNRASGAGDYLVVDSSSVSLTDGIYLDPNNKDWSHAGMLFKDSTITLAKLQANRPYGQADRSIKFDGATFVPTVASTSFFSLDTTGSCNHLLAGGLTIDTEYDVSLDALFDGVGGLTKKGSGTLTLPLNNTYTGKTSVEAGTLVINAGLTLPQLKVSAGATLEVTGFGLAVGSAEIEDGASLVVDSNTWPMSTPIVTSEDATFLAWAAGQLTAGVSLPGGQEFAVRNGSVQVVEAGSVQKRAVWTGEGTDANWSTDANWESGRVCNSDHLEFAGAKGLANINDLGDLTVQDVTFDETAGAFTLSGAGALTVVDKIVNESIRPQTVNLPVVMANTELTVETTGNVALAGGLSAGQDGSRLTKTGVGKLSVSAPGTGFALRLNEGTVSVTDVEPGEAAFSSAKDAVKVNGTLDAGGATVTIVDGGTDGIVTGSTLKNGTFSYSRPDTTAADRYLPWSQGTVTLDNANLTVEKLFSGGGTQDKTATARGLVLDNGSVATVTATPAYIVSRDNGDGVDDEFKDGSAPVSVTVTGGSTLNLPKDTYISMWADFASARNGRLTVSDESLVSGENLYIGCRAGKGWLTVADSTLDFTTIQMPSAYNGYNNNGNWVRFNNSTVTNLKFIVRSSSYSVNSPQYVSFDAARFVARGDSTQFIEKPTEYPNGRLEILAGGLTIDSNGHDITIPSATDFFGAGGLTKTGAGTLTLASANTYTGTTTVEKGKLILSGSVAGPISVAKDAELEFTAPPAISQLELTDGAKMAIAGLGTVIGSVTGYEQSIIDITADVWTMSTPIVTSPDEGFLSWLVTSLNERGLLPEGQEFTVKDGTIQVAEAGAKQKIAVWSGAGEDDNWSSDANWQGGERVRNGDNLVFDGETRTVNVNDIGDLAVLDVLFPYSAGAFTLSGEGTLTVVGGITNLSANAQTINMPVSMPQTAFEVVADADLTLGAGLSAVQEGTRLVKSGLGKLTVSRPDGKTAVTLREGSLAVTGLESGTLAFSAATDAVKVNGELDAGGAAVTIADTDAKGIIAGSTLKNGTFAYSRPNLSTDSQYLPWYQGSVLVDHANLTLPKLFEGGGAEDKTSTARVLVISNASETTVTSSPAYIVSRNNGEGLGEDGTYVNTTPVSVCVQDHSALRLPQDAYIANWNVYSAARNGRLTVTDGSLVSGQNLYIGHRAGRGWLEVTDSTLDFTTIQVCPWNSNGYGSNGDWLNFCRSTVTNLKFIVKATTYNSNSPQYASFDAARFVARGDSEEFISKPAEAPNGKLEILAGGLTIDSNGHDVGISATTDLFGAGGLVKTGEGTLTLASANTYTGATVVEEGVLTLTGSVAGPLTIGANGTLQLVSSEGELTVGGADSVTFVEGSKLAVDLSGLDQDAAHPFLLIKGQVVGLPELVVSGTTRRGWRIQKRRTAAGTLISVAPPTGFAIMIY